MSEDLGAAWTGGVPLAALVVVKKIEQFIDHPYDDNPGNPNNTKTIGYGSIRDKNNLPITDATPPISKDEAESLLQRDMASAAMDVGNAVTVPLLVREAAALISWTYNLGGAALHDSTLLKLLNQGDKEHVPAQMRRWVKQGPQVLLGLLRRRWAESAIFVGLDPAIACNRAWAEINHEGDWPAFS
jgi:lysozyme